MKAQRKQQQQSQDATTPTTTYDDGTFRRTALVITGEAGSIDLVDASGKRLAQINIFSADDGAHLMVDVIDVDNRYKTRRALVFSPKSAKSVDVPPGGNLVGVDFQAAEVK